MSKGIQAVRGMNDMLPEQAQLCLELESRCRAVLAAYAYKPIALPIVEKTALFKRSIGEVTDIVEKEMYTFADRNSESLTLRPEGTAGCVRAGIQHGLLYNQVQRLWYMGPMFRHERPQKGRTRQFQQIGVEAFGLASPEMDVEMILLSARLWQQLGLQQQVQLQINSLGALPERQQYRQALQEFLSKYADSLDEDSKRRLHTNPLRILDSKNPQTQELLVDAPALQDFLSAASKSHIEQVCQRLQDLKIPYVYNHRLVRGLDYYNDTVFEWVTDSLGAQGTVCAGGRYDSLVQMLGGKDTPAVGMAMGVERLLCLFAEQQHPPVQTDLYFVVLDDSAWTLAWQQMEAVRDALPNWSVTVDMKGGSLKNQLKRANQVNARHALLLGMDEAAENTVLWRDLEQGEQFNLTFAECLAAWSS